MSQRTFLGCFGCIRQLGVVQLFKPSDAMAPAGLVRLVPVEPVIRSPVSTHLAGREWRLYYGSLRRLRQGNEGVGAIPVCIPRPADAPDFLVLQRRRQVVAVQSRQRVLPA